MRWYETVTYLETNARICDLSCRHIVLLFIITLLENDWHFILVLSYCNGIKVVVKIVVGNRCVRTFTNAEVVRDAVVFENEYIHNNSDSLF